jgi:hypothetical protein
MTLPMFDIEDAITELRAKAIEEIEKATATTWGGRAAAAFRLAANAAGPQRQSWLMDAENYRQESIEHAAMTGDFQFLQRLHSALESERAMFVHPQAGQAIAT